MPRRKESGSGRKNSGRSGSNKSFSARATPRGKSPYKRHSDSSEEKFSGERKDFRRKSASSSASPNPRFQKTFENGRSRRKGAAEKFDRSANTFKRRDQGEANYGSPKKGRFQAKPNPNAAGRSAKRIESGERGRPNPRAAGQPHQKGVRFNKPYKKSYRTKALRESAGDRRHERKGHGISTAIPETPKSDKIRLNKFIANSGVSSRREADELITMGLISVNGKVITELGYKVNPGDEVRYESKVLRAEKPVYILMNKPKGFLTTTDDPQERKTVMHLIGPAVKERIYPVGRLDRNTTGLLLLTNDGDLADKLMHPSFGVSKIYKVELDKPLTHADFQSIAEGVRLEEGRATVDDIAFASDDKRTIGIALHIGWNRVVRRIFEALGYEVVKLDRTAYAGLDKKELPRGQWRFLSKEEIIHLKHFK